MKQTFNIKGKFFSASGIEFSSHDLLATRSRLRDALDRVGEFIQGQRTADEISYKGETSYGMQRVAVSIVLVRTGENRTTINLEAKSDDIRGMGAKRSLERILEIYRVLQSGDEAAIRGIDTRTPHELLTGVTKKKLGLIAAGIVIFWVLVFSLKQNFSWF